MKLVIQVVSNAKVEVENEIVGQIGRGLLVFVGIGQDDTKSDADVLAKKLYSLRIFEDKSGKTNLSVSDVGGDILSISQFTLFADCKHGRRPSFIQAAPPDLANELYEYFNACLEQFAGKKIQRGIFGADMKVSLLNDGPFTILLDSRELNK